MIENMIYFFIIFSFIHICFGQEAYTITDPVFRFYASSTVLSVQYHIVPYGSMFINYTGDFFKGRINFPPDMFGCQPWKGSDIAPDGLPYAGSIIIANFISCTSSSKALNVQNAQGVGLIIIISYPGPPTPSVPTIFGSYQSPGRLPVWDVYNPARVVPVTIPVVTIQFEDGFSIYKNMLNNPSVFYAEFPATGPLKDSNEMTALIALSKSIYMNPLTNMVNTTVIQDFWKNPFDPCVAGRVSMFVCINGTITQLYSAVRTISGSIPQEVNYLKNLQSILFASSGIGGIVPELNMTSLRTLTVGNSLKVTELPKSVANLINLEVFDISYNKITMLPNDISFLTKLSVFLIKYNQLTILPTIQLQNMVRYEVASNNFNYPLSNWTGNTQIKIIDLSKNKFYSNSTQNMFNNLPELVSLSLGSNFLSGSVPNFIQCPKLVNVDLSYNSFAGSIPNTWNSITTLNVINIKKNMITGPFNFGGTRLENFDASFNLINPSAAPWSSPTWANVLLSFPPIILNINLKSNKLSGPWTQSRITGALPILQNIDLSYNQITSLPEDLFNTATAVHCFSYLDISYNNLTGDMPRIVNPKKDTLKMNVLGNPSFKSSTGDIPNWSIRSSEFSKSGTSSYSCPVLKPADIDTTPIELFVDPIYYDYVGCICDRGYYGVAPNCFNIPPFVNQMIQNISRSFSDNDYGSSRLMQGMDLSWIFIAPATSQSAVINFEIFISNEFVTHNPEYPDYPNKITISSKCPSGLYFNPSNNKCDCLGGEAFSFEQQKCVKKSVKWVDYLDEMFMIDSTESYSSLVRHSIINKVATFNFQSKKTKGVHFTFNVSIDNYCPEGFEYFERNIDGLFISSKCEKIFIFNGGIQAAVFAVSSLFTIVQILITAIVVNKRNSLIIKSSSFPFCFVMLLFMILLSASGVFYAITSKQLNAICHLRAWFTAFPLTGILSALLVKADRIRKIFGSKELVVQAISNAQLAKTMGIMLLFQIGILIWFSSGSVSEGTVQIGSGSTSNQLVYSCTDSSAAWIAVQFSYTATFLFAGVVEAWGVRKVPSAFNEGPHIASTLLSLTVLLIILIPVQFMVSDNPDALIVIRGIGQTLVSTVMVFFLFGPKLYYILEGRENDKTMSSIGSSKSSSSFSVSSKNSSIPNNSSKN